MISTNSLLLSRRSLLQGSAATLAGLSISSLALSDTAIAEKPSIIPEMADASNSEFRIPTKELPIRIQYNENPLGMSLKAQKAAAQAIPLANRYPFSEIPILRKLVANYHNVNDDCILFSAGSSDAIRICIAAHATPNTQFFNYGCHGIYSRCAILGL